MCRSRMAQSLEDEEIRQEEIRQKEIKIAEMEQRIAVLQQRQREKLQRQTGGVGSAPALALRNQQEMMQTGPGSRAAFSIKDRLGTRRLQDNSLPQNPPPQPWLSGGPPDGFNRKLPTLGSKPPSQTPWSSGGPPEGFKRTFASSGQKPPSQNSWSNGQQGALSGKVGGPAQGLPADLVLTEITEEGPKAKIPPSTLNNNGVPSRGKKEEVGVEEEEEEEDLDRYENGNDFIFE